jgi:hypothetical protein
MRHVHLCVLPVVLALVSSLPAQRVLRLVHGTRAGATLGVVARAAGDLDADGVSDILLTEQMVNGVSGTPRLLIVSGTTGALLRTISGFAFDATGIADVNGDGRRDFVVASSTSQVFSGATGAALFPLNPPQLVFGTVADVGDVNGDGRGDFVSLCTSTQSGQPVVVLFSGNGGGVLAQLPGLFFGGAYLPKVRPIRDVSGDGRTDVIVSNGNGAIHVCSANPLQLLRTLQNPEGGRLGEAIATADVNGDGIDEVLAKATFGSPGSFEVTAVRAFSATNGAVLHTYFPPPLVAQGLSICRIGDLDADGADDFATLESTLNNDPGNLVLYSGRGPVLGRIPCDINTPAFPPSSQHNSYMDQLGDVDGDGFGDFVAAFASSADGMLGGYRVVSGKILADVVSTGGACGYGPFPVQLGCTRPILGMTTQVVCRDGPSGVLSTLAMSLQPAVPRYLGASTCTAAVGPEWSGVFVATAPSWTFTVAVPPAPDLAGFQVAMQAFYGPTNGPLGIDLSNGLWAKLGY